MTSSAAPLLALVLPIAAGESPIPEPPPGPVGVILDTDFGFDVDDAGALAVLHALADRGEAEVLAVCSVVLDPATPSAIDAINTYYQRPDLPIGQNPDGPDRWRDANPYWSKTSRKFNDRLAERFPHDLDAAPDAVAVYRRVLAGRPDGSVTIAAVGFLENLAELLASGPDEFSPLSGRDLVARKVRALYVMGGKERGRDFNLSGGPGKDASATVAVLETWPTPIAFQGGRVCRGVKNGATLSDEANPVAEAYRTFHGAAGRSRSSWDLAVVLEAVRGRGRLFRHDATRRVEQDGEETRLEPGGRPGQVFVERRASAEELATILEALLVAAPGEGAD